MADISPIVPFRFNPDRTPDPGAVIAPPYDVVSAADRERLLNADPYNVVRLILPEGEDDSRYRHAGELLRSWIERDVLLREPGPALYPYEQIFDHPDTGDRTRRRGFIASLTLVPFSEGSVLPHERTLSGPKADRMKLMEATEANLEAIFGAFTDQPDWETHRLLAEVAAEEPLVRAVDPSGVEHILWRLDDPDAVARIAADLKQSTVFIVDGHHRYETALAFRDARRSSDGHRPHADGIMTFLAPMSDPGLIILPTHRVVHSVPGFEASEFLERLADHFELKYPADREEGLAALHRISGKPAFLLLIADRIVLAVPKGAEAATQLVEQNQPDAVRNLDVTLLHEGILEGLLGISKEAQAAQVNLRYVKGADDAFNLANDATVQMVIMMNPPRLAQVEEVARSGSVMPQKSTFFYPKLASGLLINPLWE